VQLAVEMQQRLKLQETFDHALFHDTFTGLPNRRYFMDQLDTTLRELRTKQRVRIAGAGAATMTMCQPCALHWRRSRSVRR
jgi:GGDEF domain-containing protein